MTNSGRSGQISVDRPVGNGVEAQERRDPVAAAADAGRGRIVTCGGVARRGGLAILTAARRAAPCDGLRGTAMFSRVARVALALSLDRFFVLIRTRRVGWKRISGCPARVTIATCLLATIRAALDRIAANFGTKEGRFWNSELRIVGFENINETAVLPWAAQSIPRRFCSGAVMINDGTRHRDLLFDRRGYRHLSGGRGEGIPRRRPRPQFRL